jgi:hypothetical protein
VGRQRRRAEGPPLMADHRGLDDAVRRSAANRRLWGNAFQPRSNAERLPREPPLLAVVESGPTPACFLARRTSSTKLLTAASIADASDQDLEFAGRCSRGSLGYFCMAGAAKSLEKLSFLPSSGTADRPAARRKLSHVNGLAARGTAAFILPS